MPHISRSTVVDPARLDARQQHVLVEELFGVHQQVFAGVSAQEFRSYVLGTEGDHTRILKFHGETGEVVGFMALHIHETQVQGKPLSVFRAGAGMKRQYRGGASTLSFAIREYLRFKLRHPLRESCYFGALIHPSSHGLFDHWYGDRMWPNPSGPTPAPVQDLLIGLGDHFGMRRIDDSRPLVRDMGWRTRDTEVEEQYWRSSDKPSARFFLEQNPGYGKGEGLLTLLPLRVDWIVGIALRRLWSSLRSRMRRMGRIGHIGEGGLAHSPASRSAWQEQARRALAATPLSQGLGPDDWSRLLEALSFHQHRTGEVIVRQGEPGDAMYVIVKGSAYVCLEGAAGEDELLLDSLGPGELFGEMALVTGAPRSTTVRAARALSLLRLPRAVFAAGWARHEAWQLGILDVILRRAFRSHLARQARFSALGLRDRETLVSSLQPLRAGPARETQQPQHGALFLAVGTLEILDTGQSVRLQAPALHEAEGPWFVVDTVAALVGVLPAGALSAATPGPGP